ncbi:flagellar hook protein FlgE [Rhodovulum imhoffii]|uniref:Flagellar hook protein FlgE n=1 Tax=Rhodovulum imhoffii TaxID=365340 RepID=A0A2T5BRN5_9RHOB|nr:flagellar hook-basal body complex protein [Rhodovulum imhoffii]MBK5934063.1 flagellar biosynthesis protein FlgE [Rhodovulum imhoffii]PTN01948.1 flagellar hook protein FlgE [Rhodovulum imhoffii]
MTISSSLQAGVAGLSVNASRLATISDNIANASTFGYKRAESSFHSLVIGGSGNYTAGGVRTTTSRAIGETGPMISTKNATDLAIAGRGMLPVTPSTSLGGPGTPPLMLTTTGGFRPDAAGILTGESGMVLLGWPVNSDGTVPPFSRDSADGLQPVRLSGALAAQPTTQIDLGVNLPASAAPGDSLPVPVEYFGNLGASETLELSFTATANPNEWTLTVSDSASGPATVGEYTLVFRDSRTGGGTLDSVTPLGGSPAYDAATGRIELAVAGGPIDLNIGKPGDTGGMTQLGDQFSPNRVSKNGAPVGTPIDVEVDEQGFVHAIYDTGFTQKIFQVPLVDVPNPDGLKVLDGQAYQVSRESGDFFLWTAGTGPVGEIRGYAREQSATDVAGELTNLIQTQRAYSSNAKVIQTVDEMLQETTNIKR